MASEDNALEIMRNAFEAAKAARVATHCARMRGVDVGQALWHLCEGEKLAREALLKAEAKAARALKSGAVVL